MRHSNAITEYYRRYPTYNLQAVLSVHIHFSHRATYFPRARNNIVRARETAKKSGQSSRKIKRRETNGREPGLLRYYHAIITKILYVISDKRRRVENEIDRISNRNATLGDRRNADFLGERKKGSLFFGTRQ